MLKRISVLSLLGLLAACADTAAAPPSTAAPAPAPAPAAAAPSSVASSALTRDLSPNATASDVAALVTGNTDFAIDLYRSLGKDAGYVDADLAFSPHSVSTALAMTYAGARGTTATEIASTLHFTLPQERLHPAVNALDLALASRGVHAEQPFTLRIASSLWASAGLPVERAFLDTIATSYGSGVRLVDFSRDTEGARLAINGWVDQRTEHRIPEALGENALNEYTKLVLVNAIYFNAAWGSAFEPAGQRAFHAPAGDIQRTFMGRTGTFKHVVDGDVDAVMLPYDGDDMDLLAIAPHGSFSAFEQTLDAGKLGQIVASMHEGSIDVSLPKVTIDRSEFTLTKHLEALGIKAAWNETTADFSGIVPRAVDEMRIEGVLHKAFFAMDERGTEAAAVTVVATSSGSAGPAPSVKVELDRPFVFAVRDRATGALLFLGRVVNPAG